MLTGEKEGGGKEGRRIPGLEAPAHVGSTCMTSSGPVHCTAGRATPIMHLADSESDFDPGFKNPLSTACYVLYDCLYLVKGSSSVLDLILPQTTH